MPILQKLQPCYIGCVPHPGSVLYPIGSFPVLSRGETCFSCLLLSPQLGLPCPVQISYQIRPSTNQRNNTGRAHLFSRCAENFSRSFSENHYTETFFLSKMLLLLNWKTANRQAHAPEELVSYRTVWVESKGLMNCW